jgi:serine/threonine-protein kinase
MIGTTLRERYQIVKLLGSGGFGETYLAQDRDLPGNPYCVVKRLQPQSNKPSVLAIAERMFKTEAETLYKLQHPQIPKLQAHPQENGQFYLVQDFVDGDDLSQTELKIGHNLSETEVINLLIEILEVLAYVHQQNIIHRDIKPANLMRRHADGKICLIDFGAVKEIANLSVNPQGQPLTVVVGTKGYMPNEQANGNPQLSSDIYALGVIAIQALTGLNPDPQSGELKLDPTGELIWQTQVPIEPLFAAVLTRMVRYDFNQRYRSAVEALVAVKAVKNNNQNTYPPTSPPPTVGSPPNSGNSPVTPPTKPKKPNFWMKKKVLIPLAAAVIMSPLLPEIIKKWPLPPSPPLPCQNFASYDNSEYGFKIKYPQNWTRQAIDDPMTGEITKFMSPNAANANVTIKVEKLQKPLSLAEYSQSSIEEIKKFFPQVTILNQKNNTLANLPAYELTYQGVADGVAVQKMEMGIVRTDKAYVVIYGAEIGEYENFESTAQEMMQCFDLLQQR